MQIAPTRWRDLGDTNSADGLSNERQRFLPHVRMCDTGGPIPVTLNLGALCADRRCAMEVAL
jgi:hypothetical protein